ncbi:MAG: hypothetical protein M3Q79_02790 [bacterium]|nr:hypothetical protein [bacterium]
MAESTSVKLNGATELLIAKSYALMESVNGKLPYHNKLHAWDVVRASNAIGNLALNRGLISPKELLLLAYAASAHDLVHGLAEHGENERRSAKMAAGWMKMFKPVFSKKDIHRVEAAIESTMSDPTKPGYQPTAGDDYLQQALCDADGSHAGMPPKRSIVRSERYYQETLKDEPASTDNRIAFLENQLVFYDNHSFYTEEAKVLFPFKNLNIARTVIELDTLR